MNTEHEAFEYTEQQEATDISYVKVGNGSQNLIVSFASNEHRGFERKSSLIKLKYQRNDFDILYLRNASSWYLGGLKGIGKNITHTIAFLKRIFAKYNKVICVGSSAGVYASILFGSVCCVSSVIAFIPQTDLDYTIANCEPTKVGAECGVNTKITKFSSFEKFKNLKNHINNKTNYYIMCQDNECGNHGKHHCENLSKFANVMPISQNILRDKQLILDFLFYE